MSDVLIFGGCGFMGRALLKRLAELGYNVTLFDNESVKPAEKPYDFREFYHGDVSSFNDLQSIFQIVQPSIIYHFAAKQGYDSDWSNYAENNVQSAYLLFESIRNTQGYRPKRIILASSQAIYMPGMKVRESQIKIPPSVYGLTKLHQEMAFHHFGILLGIPVIALRYSIVLGPGQSLQSSESGLLRNWYHAWKKDKPPEVYGDGEQIRDFVHIDDVTDANVLAMTSRLGKYRSFNVGGFPQKIYQMALSFQQATGCKDPIVLNEELRPGGEYSLTSDSGLISKEWAWKPSKLPPTQIEDFVQFVTKKKK